MEERPSVPEQPAGGPGDTGMRESAQQQISQDELEAWRQRTLRLQADMDNYRRRQRRRAQEQIDGEQQRLLNAFLLVVDNLERALDAPAGNSEALRDGVRMTRRAALQLLEKEGIERIQAKDQAFDPHVHEAVAAVGRDTAGSPPNTVVQEVEAGYRMGEKLLRPARVVVAI